MSSPSNAPLVPIIVGSPRSGTTLLRLMLDSHPELAIPPETGFFWILPKLTQSGERLREEFFEAIIDYPGESRAWPDFEISEATFWGALQDIRPFDPVEGIKTFYRLYAARFNKPRWGDKTPLYCRSLEEIRGVLPEARFIHIIRDGRDASLSLRRMWFSPGWEIEEQARYWSDCVLAARAAGVDQSDYLEVRYEDLILQTADTLNSICHFLDLKYHDAMLSYYKRAPQRLQEHKARSLQDGTQLLTQENRIRQQLRAMEPPDPSIVFGWKSAMSPDERKRFERIAGSLLDDLGYEV